MSTKVKYSILLSATILILSFYLYINKTPVTHKNLSAKDASVLAQVSDEKYYKEAQKIIKTLPKNPEITRSATKTLISAYMSAKQKGKDPKKIGELIDKLSDKILKVHTIEITTKDLKVKKNINIEKYKQEMKKALTPIQNIKEYELNTIAKAIVNKDESAYKTLAYDISIYRDVVENLKNVEINKNLLTPQLKLINGYQKIVDSLMLILESKNDIILSYPGIKAFNEADANIYSAFEALKFYIDLKNDTKNNI